MERLTQTLAALGTDFTERQLQQALELCAQAMVVSNAQHEIILVNPAFTKLTGFSLAEVLATDDRAVAAASYQQLFNEKIWQEIDKWQLWQGEMSLERKSDQPFIGLVRCASVKSSQQNMSHYLTLISELSQSQTLLLLQKAQPALQLNEELLYLATANSHEGLWAWDIVHGSGYYSARFLDMLGYSKGQLPATRQAFYELLHPTESEQVLEAFKHHFLEHLPYTAEYHLRHKDGHYVYCSVQGQAAWDQAGKATHMAGFASDITQRKAKQDLNNDFVSMVSHELRTPLTSIYGSLNLIQAGAAGELPAKVTQLIDIAYRNSQQLLLLVNDLLDLAKIEAGAMRFEVQTESLQALVQQAVELNRVYAEKYQVELVIESCEPDVIVQVDASRIMQVLSNLLSNAAKFSPAGDKVIVNIERVERKVRVVVTDRGPGVPPEFAAYIFGKFAQAAGATVGRSAGTGLGLHIAKRIIEQSGGEIGFDPGAAKGAIFWFELPTV